MCKSGKSTFRNGAAGSTNFDQLIMFLWSIIFILSLDFILWPVCNIVLTQFIIRHRKQPVISVETPCNTVQRDLFGVFQSYHISLDHVYMWAA